MKPERTKATSRVWKPASSNRAADDFDEPAAPSRDMSFTPGNISICRTPRSFAVRCGISRSANTIRKSPSRCARNAPELALEIHHDLLSFENDALTSRSPIQPRAKAGSTQKQIDGDF